MALLEDKIDQISDPDLRRLIKAEVKKLKNQKRFGLVFEQHIPEMVPIYNAPIKPRSMVAYRTGNMGETYRVKKVSDNIAEIIKDSDGSIELVPLENLVVVKRFGEPIYPALMPVEKIEMGGDSPHHVLIEADNYHALQLLEYLYPNKIDCIYIDPPYNTGARDWKYNNDYVDNNDTYKHSKWLSMMQKRLVLSKQLLKDDGVLIVTIDDYELYHLGTLLEEIFPEYEHYIVSIEHNRRGRRGKNFAKSNEFAIFIVPRGQDIIQEEILTETIGGETRNLRRTGSGSLRTQRWRKFYPIFVNEKSLEVISAGDPLPLDQERQDIRDGDIIAVWPIDEEGNEKNWHYGVERTRDAIANGKLEARRQSYGVQVYYTLREKQSKKLKTVWSKSTLDASTFGTELLTKIMGTGATFDFPKSVYAVLDCINAVCGNRDNAIILDFFAGSGTTLHATLMLNELAQKNHQCIMVTNNEVSGEVAERLESLSLYPGHAEWDKHGICRSVTYPRSKYTILGKRDDGSVIEGEYITGRIVEREKPRNFRHLSFVDGKNLTLSMRKHLVSLIEGIPQTKITADIPFYIAEDSSASILFDDTLIDEYIKTLEESEHITDFYISTTSSVTFRKVKERITEKLGPIVTFEAEKKPFAAGFNANLDYFRLEFLEPNEVALGRQFLSILSILWMMAGAKGPIPNVTGDESYIIPDKCSFGVLLRESKFREFASLINAREDVTHVFIVTNSDDAFFDMKSELKAPEVIMLYKNYLKNFEINRNWKD